MTYDWERIFEEKSDKELYEIYCGNSLLPETTVSYAKNELEKRNFDFNKMELHNEVWKLSSLEEEIDYLRLEINRRTPASLKSIIFIILGLVIIAAIIIQTTNVEKKGIFLSLIVVSMFISIIIITERIIYKKKVASLNQLLEKKTKLVDKISENVNLNERQHVLENLTKESNTRMKQLMSVNLILAIITTTILILVLVFKYLY